MSIKIRKHSKSKGIYFVNDKQVIIDNNGNAVSSEELTSQGTKIFNDYLKAFENE